MTVHFIGAGPGAPDLITLRGRDLIAACPVCLYAGSLVPQALLAHCPAGARIVNTASLSLDEIMAEISAAHAAGHDVARLHSGDLSVWSAMGEQLRRLRALNIPFDVTPGVPAFAAAAAALQAELTLPGVAQSLVLTRTSGRASAMPEGESLENFARTGATLAIHLSVHVLNDVQTRLLLVASERLPWPVRLGHTDLTDVMVPTALQLAPPVLAAWPGTGAAGTDSLVTASRQADPTVLQLIGRLSQPQQIGLVHSEGRLIYDFRVAQYRYPDRTRPGLHSSAQLPTPLRPAGQELVRQWGWLRYHQSQHRQARLQ